MMLDAPHMMKLSRNLIGEYDLFISGFNLPATWRDFLALLENKKKLVSNLATDSQENMRKIILIK